MNDSVYKKDGAAKIIDLLKDTFGESGTFKAFFNGEPENIARSYLPCIMVKEGQGAIIGGATGTDEITETIQIIVALDKMEDVGASPDVELTDLKLRRLIKGQDPTTKEYLPNTIMYALRKYYTLDNDIVGSRVDTNFDVNIRGEDTVTSEATVTITMQRMALVPQRF